MKERKGIEKRVRQDGLESEEPTDCKFVMLRIGLKWLNQENQGQP